MAESIGVVGLGNWGTALANHLARNGNEVLGWTTDEGVADHINEHHKNPCYQSEVELDPKFTATDTLEEVCKKPWILIVVPSSALEAVVPKLQLTREHRVVSAVKGLEPTKNQTPLQVVRSNYPDVSRIGVVSGPSFARDVVRGRPCGVVAASDAEGFAEEIAYLFTNENMRVYVSVDPLGVELGGICKNVVALAAGVSDGLELGDSARAALITRGLAEMVRLGAALGVDTRTMWGLSGLGDLVMTSTCDESRNRRVGLGLGKGKTIEQVTEEIGSVAESVEVTSRIHALAQQYEVDMPITKAADELLNGEISPRELVNRLISRPVRPEFT